ncbi:S-methyl-5-thioribose-1-phosphate isomerase [bacterium]|nr:S-methyl-5-thioribose-1-phosphate isomerase [bacterium]
MIKAIEWRGEHLRAIDQRKLPGELVWLDIYDVMELREAIVTLAVRGAPLLGIVAGYGIYLGIRHYDTGTFEDFYSRFTTVADFLRSSRPTAVNLFHTIDRMDNLIKSNSSLPPREIKKLVLEEAIKIHKEDEALCEAIGEAGEGLIKDGFRILTHCNAGALATGGIGTALAVIYKAWEKGKRISVYADETRPLLQGARLTAFELVSEGIPTTVITDSMAGALMARRGVDIVIVGADRIAANGDVANKIGTYSLAVLAKAHNVMFYVAAPSTTFDLTLSTGRQIPIEKRSQDEIKRFCGTWIAPKEADALTYAFDVTPAELITGIITEKGIIENPLKKNIPKLIG